MNRTHGGNERLTVVALAPFVDHIRRIGRGNSQFDRGRNCKFHGIDSIGRLDLEPCQTSKTHGRLFRRSMYEGDVASLRNKVGSCNGVKGAQTHKHANVTGPS
jgi:hypothetical protein